VKYTLSEHVKVVHMLDPASYAAAAVAYTDGVDCRGFDELLIVVQCGAFTATGDVNFLVQESADDSTYAAVSGATIAEKEQADDQATYLIRINLRKRKRYIRVGYDVDDDAAIFGIFAILGSPDKLPVTASATVSASV